MEISKIKPHIVEFAGRFELLFEPYYESANLLDADDVGYAMAKSNADFVLEAVTNYRKAQARIEKLEKALKNVLSIIDDSNHCWWMFNLDEIEQALEQ